MVKKRECQFFSEINSNFKADFGTIYEVLPEPYDGSYECTPSQVEQVFSTNGKSMTSDFVVKAIPNNYGLITYNGYDITVS